MMHHELKSKRSVSLVGAIFGAVLWGTLLVYVFDLLDTRHQLLLSAAQETNKETELLRLKKDLLSVGGDEKKIEEAYISKSEVPSYLGKIEAVARSRGLTYSVTSLSLVGVDGHDALRAETVASGGYKALEAFAADLESLPYLLTMSSFGFNEAPQKEGGWESHMTIILKSYGDE